MMVTMTSTFYQRLVLDGIACYKRMSLIGFNTEMNIVLTNLEILIISALFLTKLESWDRYLGVVV